MTLAKRPPLRTTLTIDVAEMTIVVSPCPGLGSSDAVKVVMTTAENLLLAFNAFPIAVRQMTIVASRLPCLAVRPGSIG